MSYNRNSFIESVIRDCENYAAKYKCSFSDAVDDWEGENQSGSFGLTHDDKREAIVSHKAAERAWDEHNKYPTLDCSCDY